MKHIFLYTFLLFSLHSDCQVLNDKGTYLISAICKDGIVVGSDSRAVWMNNENQIAAYFDSAQKIFVYNKIVIAMAGGYAFLDSNLTFNGLLKLFFNQNHNVKR